MIQDPSDLSGSWCIKGTGESTLVMDSPVPLMHHALDRSWITDLNSDHPKGTHPLLVKNSIYRVSVICILVPRGRAPFGQHQESRPLASSNDIPVLNVFVNTMD